jgi:phospholipid N-methyltransferase
VKSTQFLRQYLGAPGRTGAVLPSSEALAHLITDSAKLADARAIVEWGPGTGVFTEKILGKKSANALFFAMELNPEFAAATRLRCPKAEVIHESATHTRKYLTERGATGCDRIICGLPWASFPDALQDELLDTLASVLNPGGIFVTFAYLQGLMLPAGWKFRKKLRARFPKTKTTRVVWLNVPPAFVYCAEK